MSDVIKLLSHKLFITVSDNWVDFLRFVATITYLLPCDNITIFKLKLNVKFGKIITSINTHYGGDSY